MKKKKREKNLSKLKLKNSKIDILKIHPINTKQNLSILNINIPNFRDILETNKEYQDNFFNLIWPILIAITLKY